MKHIGKLALGLGALGFLIPCFLLFGNSDSAIQIGLMISGAIVFGSGVIAEAIRSKRD